MGPSRKLHFGLPELSCLRFAKMPLSSQNFRIARSSNAKSTDVSTFSNGMARAPSAMSQNSLLYQLNEGRTGRFGSAASRAAPAPTGAQRMAGDEFHLWSFSPK